MIQAETGQKAFILNDADAAGMGDAFGGDAIRARTQLFPYHRDWDWFRLFVRTFAPKHRMTLLVNEYEAEVYASQQ